MKVAYNDILFLFRLFLFPFLMMQGERDVPVSYTHLTLPTKA